MRNRPKNIAILFGVILLIIGGSFFFPQVRLYVAAWTGSSDAMYKIAREYYRIPYAGIYSGLFHHDDAKGDYWIRRAAHKGNLHAFHRIIQQWDISNPHEVVYWLNHGCYLGNPWCAEQLAMAYYDGRFALAQDFVKSRAYDDLAVERHLKNGTIKDHTCIFLPGTSLGVSATSPYSPFTQREVHPGILRESAPKK